MYQLTVDSMIFEVTRRCNMACAHCMRGDAQNKDISPKVIDAALKGVTTISGLTMTGGEPSLNVAGMRYLLDAVKERGIDVFSFFVATNGKSVTPEFISTLVDWYAYCKVCNGGYDDEILNSCVALSEDEFHEHIPMENVYKLMALKGYTDVKKTNYRTGAGVMNRGRARNLTGYKKFEPYNYGLSFEGEDGGNVDIEMLTVTVDGDLLPVCDYSFDEVDDIKIGNVADGYEAMFKSAMFLQKWR